MAGVFTQPGSLAALAKGRSGLIVDDVAGHRRLARRSAISRVAGPKRLVYGQNRGLYDELKANSANAQKVGGILDKNLTERRETSAQQWAETVQAADDAMRSIGDAIRPATDMAARGLTAVAQGITKLSDGFPAVVIGIGGVVAAILAFKTASSAFKIGRGVLNIACGRRLGRAAHEDNAVTDLPKTGSKVIDAGLGVLGNGSLPWVG
ncbi:phage tail tape measure protein [Pseudomonas monteilii]|nr:phage tail tape measure protein [Pseudomonas monteilii]